MEKGDADAQRLMLAFYRVGRSRHAILRDLLSRHEVTPQQFHLLMYIKASGTARVTDLSAMMMVSKPTASRMINTLCDKGMIRKRADEKDRRLVYLDLTPGADGWWTKRGEAEGTDHAGPGEGARGGEGGLPEDAGEDRGRVSRDLPGGNAGDERG